jgi:dTMP kinase
LTGKFISLEGIDGSGKSTQLKMLANVLRSRGIDVVITREPGGTALGQALREAFLETRETVSPMAELLSFAADRAQHVEFLIKPAITEGKIVISDRYADATFAYQGAGRGFAEDKVNQVIELATGGLKPDLTLFFDISIATALSRMNDRDGSKTKKNRMDEETAEFYSRVRDAYLGIAEREPGRFRIVDAEGSVDDIHVSVVKLVDELSDK